MKLLLSADDQWDSPNVEKYTLDSTEDELELEEVA